MVTNDDAEIGRVVVLDIVGLQLEHLDAGHAPNVADVLQMDSIASLKPPFPAVTVPMQTTLGEGRSPRRHGDVSNGEYDRESQTVT